MAFWARISRLLLPGTASRRSTKTVPPQRSRVSGWSQPVHYLQIVAWIVFLILVFTTFGIFIPLLPPEWRYIAYSVTGGICLFHLLVHLIVLSIDPADANVRLKNYSRTVPTFDRSKHAHVIQRQYCHLCEVAVTVKAKHCSTCNKCVSGFDHHCKWLNNCVGSRNYWYFFTSVASAAAGLLCMVATLLYIFTQYFINPAGLRTDPHYRSISDQNTWLLLLPLFPVRTSTPVFLGIGALTLLLELVSLLLLGHLLLFHLYLRAKKLSTFEYIMQNDKQRSSKPLAVKRDVTPQRKGLSQQLDNHLRSPVQGSKKPKEFLPTSMHLSLCSATVKPEDTSSSKQPVASLSSSVQSVKLTEQDPTINIPGESSSGLQELDGTLRSSTVGRAKWKKFLLPPSRCSSVTSLRTFRPESSLKLQDAKDRRDVRQHMEGDVAENQSSASGAQGPALTESPLQGSFSASRLPVESVPETHALLSSLRGQRKDTWSQKHWDVLPSSQKPWSLESTVINISGSCQEVPHVWAVAPYTQVPKGLPVIEEEEYGMKVTPVVSVEEGCSPEEATEPGSSTKVTMIIETEDPEPEDRAAQPE
ncbi:probable palmitoyltransferase ZDHHC11B isoform X1 [Delphinapterus leucas]|uniref:Palmitoyltransferase n=1 Tax=Delphinapterus leucas TaxID=9749 RepID=A0A2Y9P4C7_DELLE|nr:probable palmitoyltransferase ZDHHC11B isoform X1 [Delphinapterus leucas]XP_022437023.1 probable palmitoyltransferase ZDHHC11B isoform X1 [Delphinapterus leucas]XP_022437026.1 probable palmitoyltransferase ZDHHC11B isoform X1 [Delphinapterus leucas]XP_030617303.1 probable palmitoyltransferase ZDHHC11B isoform X1 [Delphinapterus leucas]